MAHFAELDSNNKVIRVIVINNNELLDNNGFEKETKGIDFCQSLFGHNRWKQTSYNNSFRGRFAGIGFEYNPDADIFIEPQPFPSWSIDSNYNWQPPIPYPTDNKNYTWNEDNKSWIQI